LHDQPEESENAEGAEQGFAFVPFRPFAVPLSRLVERNGESEDTRKTYATSASAGLPQR
jgi:hypothetical protein